MILTQSPRSPFILFKLIPQYFTQSVIKTFFSYLQFYVLVTFFKGEVILLSCYHYSFKGPELRENEGIVKKKVLRFD